VIFKKDFLSLFAYQYENPVSITEAGFFISYLLGILLGMVNIGKNKGFKLVV